MQADPLLFPSITDADESAQGRVVVSGSHGGIYPGYLASKYRLGAAILNDAGGGLEDAGVQGVLALGSISVPAAAVGHDSARIGDAEDMVNRGVISRVNSVAADAGVRAGMTCREAVTTLCRIARAPSDTLPAATEGRRAIIRDQEADIILADSAALVTPEDAGKIVITGSHGGLVGGDTARALKAAAALAVFNDAGIGVDNAGTTRLPALDARGIPAVTVSHLSARIGDAASALETGTISASNDAARRLGAVPGDRLSAWIDRAFTGNAG